MFKTFSGHSKLPSKFKMRNASPENNYNLALYGKMLEVLGQDRQQAALNFINLAQNPEE